jgi:hypothetical protein
VHAVIFCASGSAWVGEGGSYDVDYLARAHARSLRCARCACCTLPHSRILCIRALCAFAHALALTPPLPRRAGRGERGGRGERRGRGQVRAGVLLHGLRYV